MELVLSRRESQKKGLESSTEGGGLEESLGKPHLLGCHIYFGQLVETKTKERPAYKLGCDPSVKRESLSQNLQTSLLSLCKNGDARVPFPGRSHADLGQLKGKLEGNQVTCVSSLRQDDTALHATSNGNVISHLAPVACAAHATPSQRVLAKQLQWITDGMRNLPVPSRSRHTAWLRHFLSSSAFAHELPKSLPELILL